MGQTDFAAAIELVVKLGRKVRRASWQSHVFIYRAERANSLCTQRFFVAEYDGRDYITSQRDFFATDWEDYNPPPHLDKVGNFQCALTCLKSGARLRRESWDTKHMWIQEGIEQGVRVLRYRGDYEADYEASTDDLLAEDWYRVLSS